MRIWPVIVGLFLLGFSTTGRAQEEHACVWVVSSNSDELTRLYKKIGDLYPLAHMNVAKSEVSNNPAEECMDEALGHAVEEFLRDPTYKKRNAALQAVRMVREVVTPKGYDFLIPASQKVLVNELTTLLREIEKFNTLAA